MSWTLETHFRTAISRAIDADTRVQAVPPWALANTLIGLALQFAALGKVGQLPTLLACHLPTVEPDEEKSLAAVREVYATLRKQAASKGAPS